MYTLYSWDMKSQRQNSDHCPKEVIYEIFLDLQLRSKQDRSLFCRTINLLTEKSELPR